MKTTCSRSGCARDSAAVRTRIAPVRAQADAVVTLDRVGWNSPARTLLARVAYLGFFIAVPGSLVMLALWHWLAHGKSGQAVAHWMSAHWTFPNRS